MISLPTRLRAKGRDGFDMPKAETVYCYRCSFIVALVAEMHTRPSIIRQKLRGGNHRPQRMREHGTKTDLAGAEFLDQSAFKLHLVFFIRRQIQAVDSHAAVPSMSYRIRFNTTPGFYFSKCIFDTRLPHKN